MQPGWEEPHADWTLHVGELVELDCEQIGGENEWTAYWRRGLLSSQELSDDIQNIFGGADAIVVTWLQGIKEEAAVAAAATGECCPVAHYSM